MAPDVYVWGSALPGALRISVKMDENVAKKVSEDRSAVCDEIARILQVPESLIRTGLASDGSQMVLDVSGLEDQEEQAIMRSLASISSDDKMASVLLQLGVERIQVGDAGDSVVQRVRAAEREVETLRAANDGLRGKLRTALQHRCDQEEQLSGQDMYIVATEQLVQAATATLEAVAEQVRKQHGLQQCRLQSLVTESKRAKQLLDDLDLDLHALIVEDEKLRREGRQKVWELSKSLEAEKGQHEALLSRKRSLSTAVSALEKQREELVKREAQANAAFQRARHAAGREHHGRVAVQGTLERVRTSVMMLQAQVHDALGTLRPVSREVRMAACLQGSDDPTSVVVELDVNALTGKAKSEKMLQPSVETAQTSPVLFGWDAPELPKTEIVQHFVSRFNVGADRVHPVRISNGRALVLVDLQPQTDQGAENAAQGRVDISGVEGSDSTASAAQLLLSLWHPSDGADGEVQAGQESRGEGEELGRIKTTMVCWEGHDGTFTLATRPGARSLPAPGIRSEGMNGGREGERFRVEGLGQGEVMSRWRRVEALVKGLVTRVAHPVRPEPLSFSVQSDMSESELQWQDDVEREMIEGVVFEPISALDYIICNDDRVIDDGTHNFSPCEAQGDLVLRDHRLPYDIDVDVDLSDGNPKRRDNAAGSWIERRLVGLPSSSNTPKSAVEAGFCFGPEEGVRESQIVGDGGWERFGDDDENAVVGVAEVAANRSNELSRYLAQDMVSGTDELTSILESAAARSARMREEGYLAISGQGKDVDDDQKTSLGSSHVIEEPCLIPSVSVSTQYRQNSQKVQPVPISSPEQNDVPSRTLADSTSSEPSAMLHGQGPQGMQADAVKRPTKHDFGLRVSVSDEKPDQEPIYFSSSWASVSVRPRVRNGVLCAFVFKRISPPSVCVVFCSLQPMCKPATQRIGEEDERGVKIKPHMQALVFEPVDTPIASEPCPVFTPLSHRARSSAADTNGSRHLKDFSPISSSGMQTLHTQDLAVEREHCAVGSPSATSELLGSAESTERRRDLSENTGNEDKADGADDGTRRHQGQALRNMSSPDPMGFLKFIDPISFDVPACSSCSTSTHMSTRVSSSASERLLDSMLQVSLPLLLFCRW